MNDEKLEGMLVALEASMIFVLAHLAASESMELDKVHGRLIGHIANALRGVRAVRPDLVEHIGGVEAAACAELDRMFVTAKSIS